MVREEQMIKMIVAVDRGNSIGWQDGRLPWKIPADMKRFKELTTDHDVLMGYNTFKSLNRPQGLPNRRNFVVTKSHASEVENPVTGLQDWVHAHQEIVGGQPKDLWVIGGATIYNQLIESRSIDEIYLTLVDADSGADVQLGFELTAWKLFIVRQDLIGIQWYLSDMSPPQRTDDGISFTFISLRKLK
jgi:dihydrofolate reductase